MIPEGVTLYTRLHRDPYEPATLTAEYIHDGRVYWRCLPETPRGSDVDPITWWALRGMIRDIAIDIQAAGSEGTICGPAVPTPDPLLELSRTLFAIGTGRDPRVVPV